MNHTPGSGSGIENAERSRAIAWLVLALMSLANFGNFYVYDSIGPVADLLQRQRDFSDSQIGMLNAIYSLPNVVLILLGGILVDRYGTARMLMWTVMICFAGTALTAWSPAFSGMAAGRLLFGIGAETFNIATLAAVVKYFSGRNLAFAVGTSIAHSPPTCRRPGSPLPMPGAGSRRSSSRPCSRRCPRRRSWPTGGWIAIAAMPIPERPAHHGVFRCATSPVSAPHTGTCWCCACSGTP
jgi:hypothetical protein